MNLLHKSPLLVLLGPTASGKTRLAVRLADALNAEIISADSRQIFRGMDIGTGKDLGEYVFNEKSIPYHLINIREAGELYNVNAFKEDFYRVFEELSRKEILPILCGGTGMYVHSLLQNHVYTAVPVNNELRTVLLKLTIDGLRERLFTYPDEITGHVDLSSHKRLIRAIEIAEYLLNHDFIKADPVPIDAFVVGLKSEAPVRRSNVIARLERRFEEGMIEEVQGLLAAGVDRTVLEFYGLEYKFITAYLSGALDYSDLKEKLAIAICQFAKRQMTFFRKMEKDGVKINWFNPATPVDELTSQVLDCYRSYLHTQS